MKAKTWPFAVASAAACAAGIGVSAFVGGPALYGAVAASLGAAVALAALIAGIDRQSGGVLIGFTIGFFIRAGLVAGGLIASGAARRNSALAYVFAFFAVYAVTQTVEVLFVYAHSRGATT